MIAQVYLVDKAHNLDSTFDYLIPQELEDSVNVGSRVLVPFGPRNSIAEAIVIRIVAESGFSKLKAISQALSSDTSCLEELLYLCVFMSNRYLCTFNQAYQLIKPPHLNTKVRIWIIAVKDVDISGLSDLQQKFMDALFECGGVADLEELEALLDKKNLKSVVYSLFDLGLIELKNQIDSTITPKFVRYAHLECTQDEGYSLADSLRLKRAKVQADIILTLCDCGDLSTADLIASSDGSYSSLKTLINKGIISIYKKPVERLAYSVESYDSSLPYKPTAEQKPVIDYLNNLINQSKHEEILLHGVTGSGKTEVFLQAIETCIKLGKTAIVLVPEISLTPQMVERFVSRFGDSVAVMHSGLSYGERYDQWCKIRRGEVNVVVGARSAIFAPIENIGIIILDEEHETSYKSELTPRYHALEIAKFRGVANNAPVLLASATPSVVSYYKANTGEYKLFEMNSRYNDNPLPTARIVDMRSELLDYHNTSVISLRLQDEIRRNLENKEKTILFLNRRGYNTFVSCRECGYVMECKNCSIALTYHKKADQLVCHYCGHTEDNVSVCPECGSKYIRFFGTGTQKIETELQTLFPSAKILRMDLDTTSRKGGHQTILDSFKNGEADILLGTQMVTKGLDFPDVTLIGVLAADSTLNIDDFRSSERCFSVITQVCGRAGRGELMGRAVIQTYQPQNVTINLAKEQNYKEFYSNEIRYRKRLNYPPFCDIVYILVSGEDEEEVDLEIYNIYSTIQEKDQDTHYIENIIGPAPSPIAKIKNKYRHRILMKVNETEKLLPMLRQIVMSHNKTSRRNTLVIDINPINML